MRAETVKRSLMTGIRVTDGHSFPQIIAQRKCRVLNYFFVSFLHLRTLLKMPPVGLGQPSSRGTLGINL